MYRDLKYVQGKFNYRYFKAEPFQEMDPLMSDNNRGSQQHQQLNLEKDPIAWVPYYWELK